MKEDALLMNKIAAAVLVAALLAMAVGYIAKGVYHVDMLSQDAFPIEVEESAVASSGAAAAPKGPADILPLLASADVAAGEKLVKKKCGSCHTFDNGGKNGTGPNLWNVVNADKAAHDGFKYSTAMTEFGGSWDYASLNQFIYKPKAYIKKTKMSFGGLKKDGDRTNAIAYLRTLSASPAPLP